MNNDALDRYGITDGMSTTRDGWITIIEKIIEAKLKEYDRARKGDGAV